MIPEELLKRVADNDPTLIELPLQETLASCDDKLGQIERLAEALKKNSHIKKIDLANNNLSYTELPDLFSALKTHPNIETMILKGNSRLDQVLTDILDLAPHCKTIIAIDAGQAQQWDKDVIKKRLASLIAEIENPIPDEDEETLENIEAINLRGGVRQNLLDTDFNELLLQIQEQDDPRVVALVQAYHQWQQIEQVLAANAALKLSERYRSIAEKLKQPFPNCASLIAEAEQLKEDGHLLASQLIRDIRIAWLINTNQEAEIEALFTELSNDNEALYKLADYLVKTTPIENYSPSVKVISYADFLEVAKTAFEGKNDELDILERHDEFLPVIFFTLLNNENVRAKLKDKLGTADVVVYELLLLAPELLKEDKNGLAKRSLKEASKTYETEQLARRFNNQATDKKLENLLTKFKPHEFKDTLQAKLIELAQNRLAAPAKQQQAAEIRTSASTASSKVDKSLSPVVIGNQSTVPLLTKPASKLRNIFAASLLILGLALALTFCGFGIAGLAGSVLALQALALTFGWMGMSALTAAIVATAVGGAAGLGLALTGLFTYFKQSRPVKTVTQGIEAGISGTTSRLSSIFTICRPCSFGRENSNNLVTSHKNPLATKSAITNPSIPSHAPPAAPST